MTTNTLRTGRLANMTPRQLYQIGHKNRFLVLETFESPEDGPCIKLLPCCYEYVDRHNPKNFRCKGHPAIYFEKVDVFRMPRKGDKSSSLILPFIGELLSLRWEEDEDNPRIVGNVLGKDVMGAVGPLAKWLKSFVESQNFL